MGLNPNDSSDSRGDKDGDGYTNIEEYINDLAKVLTGESPDNLPLVNGCAAGIEMGAEQKMASFSLFPNPYSGKGTLRMVTTSDARQLGGSIFIVDITGNVVFSAPVTREMALDVHYNKGGTFAPGVYLVKWVDHGTLVGHSRFLAVK